MTASIWVWLVLLVNVTKTETELGMEHEFVTNVAHESTPARRISNPGVSLKISVSFKLSF
jgi:hypothetical protein